MDKIKLIYNGEELETNFSGDIEVIYKRLIENKKFIIDTDKYLFRVNNNGTISNVENNDQLLYGNSFGISRTNSILAKQSARNMKLRNKLEELVMWIDPTWIADWTAVEQKKYFIMINQDTQVLETCCSRSHKKQVIGTVYMSKYAAEEIEKAFDNGLLPDLKKLFFEKENEKNESN